jgi:hypothetical protein
MKDSSLRDIFQNEMKFSKDFFPSFHYRSSGSMGGLNSATAITGKRKFTAKQVDLNEIKQLPII